MELLPLDLGNRVARGLAGSATAILKSYSGRALRAFTTLSSTNSSTPRLTQYRAKRNLSPLSPYQSFVLIIKVTIGRRNGRLWRRRRERRAKETQR